jgi:predicted RNA-binding Zn ribbon-like protein
LRFTHDTEDALAFVTALANTVPSAAQSRTDELSTPADLAELLDRNAYSGRRDLDAVELREVHAVRAELRATWTLDAERAVVEVNRMLAAANALPQLTRHDGLDWHIHATEPGAPLAERIRVEAALALVDVIRSGTTDRLRVCDADDCDGLLVDLSRNGSKRFCGVRCGNRMNVNAYRERQSGSSQPCP